MDCYLLDEEFDVMKSLTEIHFTWSHLKKKRIGDLYLLCLGQEFLIDKTQSGLMLKYDTN